MELMAKLTLLKEETRRHEEVEKMNTNLTTELVILCKQMDKAKLMLWQRSRSRSLSSTSAASFMVKGLVTA